MPKPKNTHAPAKRGAVVGFGESRPPYSNAVRLPSDWRQRMPAPETYYRTQLDKLSRPNSSGWMQGTCPFHDDHNASFSAHMVSGRWRCFAGCGGGDLIGFHMSRHGLEFRAAVLDLIKGAR